MKAKKTGSELFFLRTSLLKKIILTPFFCFIFMCGCQQQKLYKSARVMMGTFVEVVSPDSNAAGIVFKEFQRIEDLLSKYKPKSEVSRLNANGSIKASPETFYIIKRSKEFWEASGGAFDITVAPLVDLWGFTDKKYAVPPAEKIKEALARVGSDKILLHDDSNVVEFKNSAMEIDLGGIAKGFALDCAVRKLREAGIKSCLLNAGGQVFALGDRSGKSWRVALAEPRTRGFSGYVEIKDQSASTSGDYEQYFIKGNKRYSHILDPRTGFPAASGVISATVIAPEGAAADALSTAVFVLGKTKGRELLKRFPGVEATIIEEKDI